MDQQDDEFLSQIKGLLSQQMGIKETKLNLNTRLREDLGVDGDDAEEFLLAFKEQFDVDMSDFEFSRYFGPEAAFNPFVFLWDLLSTKTRQPFVPVSLSDLVESGKAKEWRGP